MFKTITVFALFAAFNIHAAIINANRVHVAMESRTISVSREYTTNNKISYTFSALTIPTTSPNGANIQAWDMNNVSLKSGAVSSLLVRVIVNLANPALSEIKQQLDQCFQAGLLDPAPDTKVRYFKLLMQSDPATLIPMNIDETKNTVGISFEASSDNTKTRLLLLSCGR